jgi:hypothetical protein
VPLLSEIFGALFAGALVIVIARQLGLNSRRAFGAVAIVAVSAATLLALPTLREDVSEMLSQRKEYLGLSTAEANVKQGSNWGLNTAFLMWVKEHFKEGETFALEIGSIPGEETFEGGGVLFGSTLAWASFQLAPNLMVEESVGPEGKLEVPEGAPADWIVFYQKEPDEYAGSLGKVIQYEPKFAIARPGNAR